MAGLVLALAGPPPCSRAQAAGSPGFAALTHSTEDRLLVPAGYAYSVVVRWGDPVIPGAPGFDPRIHEPRADVSALGRQDRAQDARDGGDRACRPRRLSGRGSARGQRGMALRQALPLQPPADRGDAHGHQRARGRASVAEELIRLRRDPRPRHAEQLLGGHHPVGDRPDV
ncbi:MAG: DUF839 domain-containing protein [Deltaproteobacteria bacterium]|nr:DUF839 domain-containing protein [Deltaproteobacteria bacterium]